MESVNLYIRYRFLSSIHQIYHRPINHSCEMLLVTQQKPNLCAEFVFVWIPLYCSRNCPSFPGFCNTDICTEWETDRKTCLVLCFPLHTIWDRLYSGSLEKKTIETKYFLIAISEDWSSDFPMDSKMVNSFTNHMKQVLTWGEQGVADSAYVWHQFLHFALWAH